MPCSSSRIRRYLQFSSRLILSPPSQFTERTWHCPRFSLIIKRMQNDLPEVQWQDVGRTDEMGDQCGLQIYMWLQCLINALCSPKSQFRRLNWLKWVPLVSFLLCSPITILLAAEFFYRHFIPKVTPNPSTQGLEYLGLTAKHWLSELLATF